MNQVNLEDTFPAVIDLFRSSHPIPLYHLVIFYDQKLAWDELHNLYWNQES